MGFLAGLLAASLLAWRPQQPTGWRVATDSTVVHVGDSVYFRAKVEGIPGRYWWHLHGPGLVTVMAKKGTILVLPP